MSVTKNIVESFREVVQDLLVPELKAVKVSVDALHSEMGYLRTEVKGSIDALRTEMKCATNCIRNPYRVSPRSWITPSKFRERLAAIETRLPRQ